MPSSDQRLEWSTPDDQVAYPTKGAIIATSGQGDNKALSMYSQHIGNHVRVYLAEYDPAIDRQGNLVAGLKSMDERAVANFRVGRVPEGSEVNEFFSPQGIPDHNRVFDYVRKRINSEYLSLVDEFDTRTFDRFITKLQDEKSISGLFIPSPLKIHRLTVDKVKDGTPPATIDVVEVPAQSASGETVINLSLNWAIKDRSAKGVSSKLRFPLMELPIEVAPEHPLKSEIVQSYLNKVSMSISSSIKFKNNIQYHQADGFDGFAKTLQSHIPTAVEKNPPKVSERKRQAGDEFALCYVASALQELGYASVAEGNMERQFRHFHFKPVDNSAATDVKVKFVDSATLDRVSKGYEELSRDPSVGIDVRKGKGVKGALGLLYYLSEQGIIKDKPSSVLKAVTAHLGGKPKDNIVSLDSVSHSTVGNVYVAPFMTNKGVEQAKAPVSKVCALRGLSNEVRDKLVDEGVMGVVTMKQFGDKPDHNVIVANLNKGVSPQRKIAQQYFSFDYMDGTRKKTSYDGVIPNGAVAKLNKLNVTSSDMKGAGAVLAGSQAKSIVLSEAFIDMAAAYDMTRAVGLNTNDFTFVSVQSAGNTDSWFSEATGGFRPATADELEKGASPVMRDLVEETPIETRDMQIEKVRDFFEGFSKVIFLRTNTPENKAALNQFNRLVSAIGSPTNVNVYGDRGTYFKPRKASSGGLPVATFNDSNFGKVMRDLGVKFDKEGNFESCVNRVIRKVGVDAKDIPKVRDHVVRRLGVERIVMAYDADHAGMGQAKPFIEFTKALGLQSNVLTLPLVSKDTPDISTKGVMETLATHGHKLSDVPFSSKDLLNDMNDAVRFVNSPQNNPEGAKRTKQAVLFALSQNITEKHESYVHDFYQTVLRLKKLEQHQKHHGAAPAIETAGTGNGRKKKNSYAMRR